MDKEVLRELWNGQLPLCFKLHPDDVIGMHRPEPYYIMVPRITYFPIVLDRVVKYFNRFMDQSKHGSEDMWLDYDGQAIKWQHPIGLSWDLLSSGYDLPWRLILHFSDFPTKDLVRCNTKASIKTNFMSSIKEADALKHKGSVIRNMLEKEQNQLWSGLINNKFDQFWSINKKLMDKIDNELFRYIPFRLYLPDYTYIQKIVKPCTTERHIFKTSVGSTKAALKDNIFDKDMVINKAHKCGHTTAESVETDENNTVHRSSTMLDLIQTSFNNRMDELLITLPDKSEDEEKKEPDDKLIDVKLFRYRFLTHGIEIPFDTPLQWLSEHLSYPDNFLHICAVRKSQ